MSKKFGIKNVEIFLLDDGTECADVRVQFGADEFSIQIGTGGRWSFAPEAETSLGDIGRFVAEYPNIDAAAAGMAALVGARQSIESEKSSKIVWTARNNSSFLNGRRPAKSLAAAVRAARAYINGELYGEGTATIFENGYPVRQDECSIYTGFRWETKTNF